MEGYRCVAGDWKITEGPESSIGRVKNRCGGLARRLICYGCNSKQEETGKKQDVGKPTMRYVHFMLPEKSRSLVNPQLSPSGDKQITKILDSPAKESWKEELGEHSGKRLLSRAKAYLGRGPRPR